MEANELRLNNLIQCVGKVHIVTPDLFHIIAITASNNYEPIPLTEEWLVKFGATITNKGTRDELFHIHGLRFRFMRRGLWLIDSAGEIVGKNKIWYVHQLQNLCHVLTGEEITASEMG